MNFLKQSRYLTILILINLIFFGQANLVWAQSDKQTEQDLLRLENEKKKAVLQKEIAEAEAAELKAKFPDAKSTPLEGKTTIDDGVVIETQIMAYKAMKEVAEEISGKVTTASSGNIKDFAGNDIRDVNGNTFQVKTIAVYDQKEKANLLAFRTAKAQFSLISNQYCEIFNNRAYDQCPPPGPVIAFVPPVAAPLAIATSLLGKFVDLTSFLRTNVEIKGKSFVIDEPAIASEVFTSTKSKNAALNFYYPAMFSPSIDGGTESKFLAELDKAASAKLLIENLLLNIEVAEKDLNDARATQGKVNATLTEVREKKRETTAHLSRLQKTYTKKIPAEVQQTINELLDLIGKLTGDEAVLAAKLVTATANVVNAGAAKTTAENEFKYLLQDQNKYNYAIVKAKIINQQLDRYISNLIETDKASGTNSLTSNIKAEQLESVMSKEINVTNAAGVVEKKILQTGYWLQIKVLQAGGNNRIKTNLIWDIFTGGNRLSHSGGVIVQYILFDPNGNMVQSGTVTKYMYYRKAKKI